jgi:hypothetical protein
MIAIYPFIGTSPSGSRLNLKDVSLNTTQVNYSGSWSTSLSGSYNNNTASYGILSNITPSYVHPLINSQSIHLSYLSYDTPVSGGYLMGVEQIPGLPGDISTPAAAYSVRKVRTAYTGFCMDVRRDSDNTTGSIGFDAFGNLDTGSLLAFATGSAGTGSGFVKTWYDQSGNNRHATQTATGSQPLIINSGSLYIQNSKPAVYFNGVAGTLLENTSYSLPTSTPVSFMAVVNPSSSNNNFAGLIGSNGGNGIMFYSTAYWNIDGSGGGPGNSATVVPDLDRLQIITGILTTSTTQNSYIFKNGTLGMYYTGGGAPRAGTGIQIGGRTGGGIPSRVLRGFIQEATIFNSSIIDTRSIIESNINSYFNIY